MLVSHQETGRGKEWFSCLGCRGSVALKTPWFQTPGLQVCEIITFCCLSNSSVVLCYGSSRKQIYLAFLTAWLLGSKNVPREQGRSTWHFKGPELEVTKWHFCLTSIFQAVTTLYSHVREGDVDSSMGRVSTSHWEEHMVWDILCWLAQLIQFIRV